MTTFVVTDSGGWQPLASTDLPDSGVTAGTYGDNANVAQVTVDAKGIVTAAANVAIAGGGGGGSSEIAYAQITTNAAITDTAEATATALITLGPATYTAVPTYLEFCAPYVQVGTTLGNTVTVTIFEGATELGRIALLANFVSGLNMGQPVRGSLKLTPSAASHTYKLCAFTVNTAGVPQIIAGAGGTAAYAPAFFRSVVA